MPKAIQTQYTNRIAQGEEKAEAWGQILHLDSVGQSAAMPGVYWKCREFD